MRVYGTIVALASVLLLAGSVFSQEEDRQRPCASPEARQFDFWMGNWTVHAKGKIAGHNRISSIHNGCTLFEEYTAANSPYEGKSFNYYDPGDGNWHQVWVDNNGLRLHLTGGYSDGSMVMSGERAKDGEKLIDRITWNENDDGTIRQLWEVSRDDGTTWDALFDGRYERSE